MVVILVSVLIVDLVAGALVEMSMARARVRARVRVRVREYSNRECHSPILFC